MSGFFAGKSRQAPRLALVAGLCVGMATFAGAGGIASAATARATAPAAANTRAATNMGAKAKPVAGAPVAFAAKGIPLPQEANLQPNYTGPLAGGDDEITGSPPVALAGPTVFVATGASLEVLDGEDGRLLANVKPVDKFASPPLNPSNRVLPDPPKVMRLDGKRVALAGYVVTEPGHGTTPPQLALEIDAVDTGGHRLLHAVTPLAPEQRRLDEEPLVRFAGSSGNTVAVVIASDADAEGLSGGGITLSTVGVNLATGKALWHNESFYGMAVANGIVVGQMNPPPAGGGGKGPLGDIDDDSDMHLAGLNLQTGQTAWTGTETLGDAQVEAGASGSVFVESKGATNEVAMLNAKTGQETVLKSGSPTVAFPSFTCEIDGQSGFDGRSVLLCHSVLVGGVNDSNIMKGIFAIDATTGQTLWQLPDKASGRVAPTVTAVYDGKLYGTTLNGPVVLDLRTGKDVNDSPKVAPLAVDSYVGVADTNKADAKAVANGQPGQPTLKIYRATR